MTHFQVYPNPAALAQAAARHLAVLVAQAGDKFSVALAGGSTPRTTYELLSSGELASQVDWSRVHVYWGDERCVPPDHKDSNFRMAKESLLDKVPVPEQNIHRIRGELDPRGAAAAYETELEATLGEAGRLDLIILGMGDDGHTASLFPGSATLRETRPVASTYVEHLDSWRVTLTLPSINAARNVLFLITGAAKAQALSRVRAGEPLPAALVTPVDGRLIWLVDQAAWSQSTHSQRNIPEGQI